MIGPSYPQDHKPTARRCAEPPSSRTHRAFRPQNKMVTRQRDKLFTVGFSFGAVDPNDLSTTPTTRRMAYN
ncbi:hypothetical protein M0802_009833 [Mischocyttarus mexicanus]|nr:hypothetical protein M0802_009833 [Mischocyttarus mexicanus]